MKRQILFILTAVLALSAISCNKFLDKLPDNRTELDSEEKIRRLLTSAYPGSTYMYYLRQMTDDYDMLDVKYPANEERFLADAWAWKDDMEEGNDSPKNTWEAHYLAIAHANQALDAIEELGNPEHLDPLRGEALLARAWCHFRLVNLFSQHYSEAYGGTDLGITYMEHPETEVNPHYERGTVKDVYAKIERDILEGLPLIDDGIYEVPKYHFNRKAANAFAAEFFLYYRKYDECIKYADEVLGSDPRNMLRNLSTFSALPFPEGQWNAYINPSHNANLLLVTSVSEAGLSAAYGANSRYNCSEYIVRNEGLLSYSVLWTTSGILGTNVFYMPVYGLQVGGGPRGNMIFTIPYMFELTDPVNRIGFAHTVHAALTAELALLCRAEAQVHLNNLEAAMTDINHWVAMRCRTNYNGPKTVAQVLQYYGNLPYYTPTAPTVKKRLNNDEIPLSADQESFIHALLQLRRMEFHDTGTRWFDIKRYGIEITRRSVSNEGITDLNDILVKRDERRALQIPSGAIVAGVEPNPRTTTPKAIIKNGALTITPEN
ncbi:MAG: RagB/SusD family nutrient uptake outer membrane protein [Alistipes sp.]|jgi:hypothetical protein|nr:RagB/SusD family nutrient uptake outer membrane protein [Alistipes sp.]